MSDKHKVTIVRVTNDARFAVLDDLLAVAKEHRKLELVFEGRLFSIRQAEQLLATLCPADLVTVQ